MKLSFMTWLCPDWDVKKIISAAKKNGYDGVEVRVESKQKHGIELEMDKVSRKETAQRFKGEGVEISCIATSLTFAMADQKQRNEHVEKLKKYIDLAAEIGAPYVRVFGGVTPEGIQKKGIVHYIAEALARGADHAIGTDVEVLIETHDDFSISNRAAAVVREAKHRKVNILWDLMHPWREFETFDETYRHLRPFIRHCHIHDGKYMSEGRKEDVHTGSSYTGDITNGKIEVKLLGEGELDHRPMMQLLKHDGYKGHFSVEIIGKGEPDKWIPQYAEKFRAIEKILL